MKQLTLPNFESPKQVLYYRFMNDLALFFIIVFSSGIPFYVNSVISVIGKCQSNPKISQALKRLPVHGCSTSSIN